MQEASKRNSSSNKMKVAITSRDSLPQIPSKRYFTIGEASDLCELKPHVLRYWETEFNQLRPVKRRGNRRYYRPEDLKIIRDIRELLHEKGYTIQGARQHLVTQAAPQTQPAPTTPASRKQQSQPAAEILTELQSILDLLS